MYRNSKFIKHITTKLSNKKGAIPFDEMCTKDLEWFPNRMPTDIPYKQRNKEKVELNTIPVLDENASIEDLQKVIDFIGKGRFSPEEIQRAFELQAKYQKIYNEKKRKMETTLN